MRCWVLVSLLGLAVGCWRAKPAPADAPPPAGEARAPDAEPDPMAGVVVREVAHAGRRFRVVTVDITVADLDLYGAAPEHAAVHTMSLLRGWLTAQGRRLLVVANAGMFHADRRPVGLHVERGIEYVPLSTGEGEGNFFLKPNGVFWVDAAGAHVAPSERWPGTTADVRLATQSGPLLLDGGALHPAFREDSPNLNLRSAVGVSHPSTVHLVISEEGVRFWELATLFRDVLRCDDALYLDGVISRMDDPDHFAPHDDTQEFGGMLAITASW